MVIGKGKRSHMLPRMARGGGKVLVYGDGGGEEEGKVDSIREKKKKTRICLCNILWFILLPYIILSGF